MDLNQLLHAHQVAVMKAGAAGDATARDDHFAKVAEYAERICQLRDVHAASGAGSRPGAPQTIIYGSYAGENDETAGEAVMTGREDEGGATNPSSPPQLPDGVTEKIVRQYHVGPYVYQDLELAVAEHLRQLSAPPPR